MNKQKKKITIALIGAIALAIAIILFVVYRNSTLSEEDILRAIDDAWNNAADSNDPDYLQAIERVSTYEIVSIEDGDYYTIHMMITGIDVGSELEQISLESFAQDEDAVNAYLIELINQCLQVQTEAVIYAIPKDDGLQITFSDEFVDAMTGKIYSYYMDKVEEILGGTQ
jgi:hypothetical protein